MKFFSQLPTFMAGIMLKLANFPGLGFLQNYVVAATAAKAQFGDKVEDYVAYMELGQQVIDDAKMGPGGARPDQPRGGSRSAAQDPGENVYDDYEYGGESSGVYLPTDDYPQSDDRYTYFNDDY